MFSFLGLLFALILPRFEGECLLSRGSSFFYSLWPALDETGVSEITNRPLLFAFQKIKIHYARKKERQHLSSLDLPIQRHLAGAVRRHLNRLQTDH